MKCLTHPESERQHHPTEEDSDITGLVIYKVLYPFKWHYAETQVPSGCQRFPAIAAMTGMRCKYKREECAVVFPDCNCDNGLLF